MIKKRKKLAICTASVVLTLGMSMTSFAGWQSNKQGRWYETSNGGYYTDMWKDIDGAWYHFGLDGYMQTGWYDDNGVWYYLGLDGRVTTNWQYINNNWYYLNEKGQMQTGWQKINNKWYFLNADGSMRTGWYCSNNLWYYLDEPGGNMRTGWIKLGNDYFYCNDDGVMLTGQQRIGDSYYLFGSEGRWLESSANSNLLPPTSDIEACSVLEANMSKARIRGLTEHYYDKYYNDLQMAFSYVNDLRDSGHKLDYSENLTKAATAHAIDMISYNYFGHDNSVSQDVVEWRDWARLYSANIDGEMIVHDTSIKNCIESFKKKPDDLKNLQNTAYTTVGVGFALRPSGEMVMVIMLQK